MSDGDREVAVVAGVGSGLGWALARRFAQAGMRVVALARNEEKVRALTKAEPALDIHARACDVTNPAQVAGLFDAIAREHGAPHLAVFNAGAYERGLTLELSPEAFERCWRVGCFGGFLVGQAAARAMVPAGRGSILFTGATASLRGGAGFAALASPKFALRAVAQSMARELGPKGIHVAHVIIDGQIGDVARDGRPADSFLPPAAIAEAYYQLHLQPRGAWTQEQDLRPWVEKF